MCRRQTTSIECEARLASNALKYKHKRVRVFTLLVAFEDFSCPRSKQPLASVDNYLRYGGHHPQVQGGQYDIPVRIEIRDESGDRQATRLVGYATS